MKTKRVKENSQNNFQLTLQLNNNLIEVEKTIELKRERDYREKLTLWQYKECEQYICLDYWNSDHINKE